MVLTLQFPRDVEFHKCVEADPTDDENGHEHDETCYETHLLQVYEQKKKHDRRGADTDNLLILVLDTPPFDLPRDFVLCHNLQ